MMILDSRESRARLYANMTLAMDPKDLQLIVDVGSLVASRRVSVNLTPPDLIMNYCILEQWSGLQTY